MDIYSHKIVGWQIHDREISHLAADLMTDTCLRENVDRDQIILYSGNGSPMKGAKMKHPERWSRDIRDWSLMTEIHLNPEKKKTENTEAQAA